MTATKRKPSAAKPAAPKPVSEAAKWHAEAMAAPLPEPLSPAQAMALTAAYPHRDVAILEPLSGTGGSYVSCHAITEEDCRTLLDEWTGKAREATFGNRPWWVPAGTVTDFAPASPWPAAEDTEVVMAAYMPPVFTADLPEKTEVALVRFNKAHDAESGEPGTTVFEPGELMTETFGAVTDEGGAA